MKNGFFVTGTDTGIGKTHVSALLLTALRDNPASYWKPIQTGEDDDTQSIAALTRGHIERLTQPYIRLRAPAAPLTAARLQQTRINVPELLQRWHELGDGTWIVEGAGGLLVPITEDVTMAELARALGLPVIVVASTRLGTINHTLLTLEAARARGLQIAGLILNGPRQDGLAEILNELGKVRVLIEVPHMDKGIDAHGSTATPLTDRLRERLQDAA